MATAPSVPDRRGEYQDKTGIQINRSQAIVSIWHLRPRILPRIAHDARNRGCKPAIWHILGIHVIDIHAINDRNRGIRRVTDLTSLLKTRKHWFFDLDGTVYLGHALLPGALELILLLREKGTGYTFLTNNSSKSSLDYYLRLEGMGVPLQPENVFTSGLATGLYLHNELPEARVFLLGTPSLAAELGRAGVQLVEESPDTVVVGYDTGLSYARLTQACLFLRSGARYLVTHPDLNCPTPDGPVPDTGSFMALIEASTGRTPELVIGKPNVEVLRQAARREGVPLADCIMVGDRIETDMLMARNAGAAGVLVLSGVTDADDDRLRDPAWHDSISVAADVAELHGLLTQR